LLIALKLAARLPFYYGWIVAGAVALTIVMAMTLTVTTLSAFVAPLSDEFGWSRGEISGVVSFGTLGAAVSGPLFGRWVDRYGARVLLTVGSLAIAASLVGMASMQNLFMFTVAFTVGRTVMFNLEHLVGPTAVANWFVRRRATATALVMSSSRVGLGLWPAFAGVLFVITSWRTAFWVFAIIVAVAAIVPWLFVIARRPEDIGMAPDTIAPSNDGPSVGLHGQEHQWTARAALRTQAFWLILVVNAVTFFVAGGVGLHRVPYFIDNGLSTALVGPVLIGFAVGMGIGGFMAARLMRRFSEQSLMAMLLLASGGAIAVLLITPANAWAIAYALGEGTVFGGLFTIQPVIYANYYGRASVGTIRGLASPFVMVSNAAGALFAGVVYDLSGDDYTIAFVTFITLFGVSAVVARMARKPTPR
jgi:OFA family oxalate/formate antiporter-like MFS transporter